MKQQILWVVEMFLQSKWQMSVFAHPNRENARAHAKRLRQAHMETRVVKYIRSE